MKLSLVFELLLIFILLAFAASKSVRKEKNNVKKGIQNRNDVDDKIEQNENNINKYCKCVEAYCNCCREFKLPVVELHGPGCASLMYLNGDKMSVSLSFGKKVITNRTLSSKKPSPVCMPLPGGLSKFCGRVYNIARAGEEFRACLGLELQSKRTVEAAVRVSCFKFGPRGVTSEPADPLPLVPQDEKSEDDDDDDDYEDDDAFGLGAEEDDDDDDDDDDDEDGTLDAVNDVDSADYTGFSLLGEDILGDLFGSTSVKKPNKNKKKQAPAPSTTTTTTRRPRPSRRPTRRPGTRTTTLRPRRTTTARVTRPHDGNRRPTRRPTRRPNRKPTTESTSTSILTTTTTTTTTTASPPVPASSPVAASLPVVASQPVAADLPVPASLPSSVTAAIPTTERNIVISTIQEQSPAFLSDMAIVRVTPILPATTPKSVTDFEDPGLEMSLAHITGQLSAMPVTPIISNGGKDSNVMNTQPESVNYEKVITISPKTPSTVSFSPTSEEVVNDDMIQIIPNSASEEIMPEKEVIFGDESRAHLYQFGAPVPESNYEGLTLPKKKNRNKQFNLRDLDVLDLGQIGETLGDELGIFGKNKRHHRDNKDIKVHGDEDQNNEYNDFVDDFSELALMMRKSNNNKNKKDRRRQNKMMREWSQV